jgi:outer membrane protein
MKNLVLFLFVLSFNPAFTQDTTVIAFVNMEELLAVMPEMKGIEAQLNALQMENEKKSAEMLDAIDKKYKEYQKRSNDKRKKESVEQIINLEKQYKEFRKVSNEELAKKQTILMGAINDKLNGAIKRVAEKYGYDAVFDSSQSNTVYFNTDKDITELVKKELGIK